MVTYDQPRVEVTRVPALPRKGTGEVFMKKLFLAAVALLFAPSFAHSADLSVQVVPATPSIPAAARNAGFTTLAQSWDFSQPLYAVQSNWYDCSGVTFSNPAQLFHQGNPGVVLNNPCNVNQIDDGGVTVMDFQYLTSYEGNGFNGQFNQVGGQTADQNGNVSIDFPNMYIETVARVARTFGAPNNSGGPNDVWTWSDPPGCPLEIDVFELYEDQGGFGNASAHSWCTGATAYRWQSYSPNNLPAGWKPTDYHKYGTLLTSDGATETYACGFVDDILQGCGPLNAASQPSSFTARNRVIASAGSNAATAAANIDLDIQYINVYSCGNWKTQMCNGPALFNSNGLIYWH
jgi:hypothetical protein